MTAPTAGGSLISNPRPTGLGPPSGYALGVEHVTKRYGSNTVVDDFGFTELPGRVPGFLGQRGRRGEAYSSRGGWSCA